MQSPPRSLSAMRAVIPRQYFRPDPFRAVCAVMTAVAFLVAAECVAAYVWMMGPFWLFPIAWWLCGMAFVSCFVLGHDCGHFSFIRNRPLMIVMGHLLLLPSLHPFFAWKYLHDAHHRYANLLRKSNDIYFDNAWHPWTVEEYVRNRRNAPWMCLAYRLLRACPPVGTLLYLVYFHFDLRLYRPRHRLRVIGSLAFEALAMVIVCIVLAGVTGSVITSLLHFWILPLLCLQCWVAVYTLMHHISVETRFYPESEWQPYRGQITSTVNCRFPRWISFLHFNVDIHVPHHLAANIPSYWLRNANDALKASGYASDIREVNLSLEYFWTQVRTCKLWDSGGGRYVSFPGHSS
jgi:acyl-lipid omega-6 desaturase (Delta-12 desaturase)